MRKIHSLLIILLLTGCKTIDEAKLLGSIPECTNKICKETNVTLNGKKLYCNNRDVYIGDNYLLDIVSHNKKEGNDSAFITALSFGLIPYSSEYSVYLDATLKTKHGVFIKNYQAYGETKKNIAATFYGYSLDNADKASMLESTGDALRALYQKINADDKVYTKAKEIEKKEKKEAERLRKKNEQNINKLKEIIDGHRVVSLKNAIPISQIISVLNRGDIIFLYSMWLGLQKFGIFAGQNVIGEGNLADFESPYESNKVFLYGDDNYTDGQPLKGYYRYTGNYTYVTVLGTMATVPAFRQVDIPEELVKYIDKTEF